MKHVSFDAGEIIFREGTYGESMYEIASGEVYVYAGYESDGQTLLATLGKGEIFGEMGLIEYWSRSATVVAAKDGVEVDEIGSDEYMSFLQNQPEKVMSIMRQLSARLRETNKKYEEACHTVFEAVEAERAQKSRDHSLRSRISGLIRQLTHKAS